MIILAHVRDASVPMPTPLSRNTTLASSGVEIHVEPLGTIEINDEEGRRWVFLTLRGFLEHPDSMRWVAVDRGAIPFLMNGADCMVAGVHGADEDIEVGDLVWIRDKEHGRPLAIGWATMPGSEMVDATKGKGIKTIHWVGDELWDMEA